MRAPANLRVKVSDHIELEWDRLSTNHFEYEITRYKSSVEAASEIIKIRKRIESSGKKLTFVDQEDLEPGGLYFYTVCYLCPGKLLVPLKPVRARFMPQPPLPVEKIKVVPLSRRTLAISWEHVEDVTYDIYIEPRNFFNIADKIPVLTTKENSCLYEIPTVTDRLFVAVVGKNSSGQRILTVSPELVREPWRDALVRSLEANFSLTPLSQFQSQEIVVEITNGIPFSTYNILIGTVLLPAKITTDMNGTGKVLTTVPETIGPGRHSIVIDNGEGSVLSTENSFLVPVKLSPAPNDIVESNSDPLVSGFDTSIVDRIRFVDETVSFRFRKGKTIPDLKMNICQLMAQFRSSAIDSLAARINVPVRLLPTFSYPPFIFNATTGSLNLFGVVQSPVFDTALDWATQINEAHSYDGGIERVVASITEFDSVTQSFSNALVDTGVSYEGDFPIGPGSSYLIEVRAPVNNYAVSGDGISSFNYLPLFNAPLGGFHSVVLVADGGLADAESWAMHINTQHLLLAVEPRVVTSISRWSATSQSYDMSLIDTGSSYEGNFNLIPGQGYIVELKEPVSNYVLTGTELTESTCP